MDLRDYPRPVGDTGIGIHWNAGFATAVGLTHIREYWLPEILAMGVKWVKIAHHDGALSFAELLLQNGVMPIVRVYRTRPNPGTLSQEDLRLVKNYVDAGARYFEFNNEPDLDVEWQHNEAPQNAPQIVAHNAIIDIEAILRVGGLPGLPAVAVGCQWDLVGEICRAGRRDLFREPVWVALHNYSLNHPLDYPLDPGNQQGAPYSREFYDRVAAEQWGGNAWGDWSLERVNQERRNHANPGATAVVDPSCWRAYERHDLLVRRQIGRSLPILATEDGYLVGEHNDRRYPATTPQLHMAQTLEAARVMMGVSQRFELAPDYLFCSAFWLLANYKLGHWAPGWEGHAWYSDRWPGGRLPIVAAMQVEPKQARGWRGDGGVAGNVSGLVLGGADLTVTLLRTDTGSDAEPAPPDGWESTLRTDAEARFVFPDVPPGEYLITVVEAERSQELHVTRARPNHSVEFDVTDLNIIIAESTIRGRVRCGAGLTIRLGRPADGWFAEQVIAEDGTYYFADLVKGVYVLVVGSTGVARAGLRLDGRNHLVVDLDAPGWWWESSLAGAGPGFCVLRCRVTGHAGVPVHLSATGWPGLTERTGSKAEYGPDVCEFAPLGAGLYTLRPEGIDLEAQIELDGASIVWVTFTETIVNPSRASAISGHVAHAAGRTLSAIGPEGERTTTIALDHSFSFEGLPAGVYGIAIGDNAVAQDQIVLDGLNREVVELEMPASMRSVVFGTVTHGIGLAVRVLEPLLNGLIDEVMVGEGGAYRMEGLGAGIYSVHVVSTGADRRVLLMRDDVRLNGTDHARLDFTVADQAPRTRFLVEDAGPGPGFSIIRCQVLGQTDLEVRLSTSGWLGTTVRTGTKDEYGPDSCEFAPLGPGLYNVEPAGLAVRAVLQLEPNRIAWVRFVPAPPLVQSVDETDAAATLLASIGGTITQADGAPAPIGTKLAVRVSGPRGQDQTPVVDGAYQVTGLMPGIYQISVLLTEPGPVELAGCGPFSLAEGEQARVDLEWSPSPASSGRIVGQATSVAGQRVVLAGPGGPFAAETDENGGFRFDCLFPGEYQLTLPGSAENPHTARVMAGIVVDGRRDVRVELGEEDSTPDKQIEHYFLVGAMARSEEDFLALLEYAARFRPTIGRDEMLARQARHVTILGGKDVISNLIEQSLRMSGCEVRRITDHVAERLGRLLDTNTPY